jgi:hypothetical protein
LFFLLFRVVLMDTGVVADCCKEKVEADRRSPLKMKWANEMGPLHLLRLKQGVEGSHHAETEGNGTERGGASLK